MATAPDPDGDLVRLAREGDRPSFNQLVLKYRNRVVGIAARMLADRAEAEDLAQDVFVKVYHSLRDFNGDALFSTWLYRIAVNHCFNRKRKRKREREVIELADEVAPGDSTHAAAPHTLFERKQLTLQLERAIREIREEWRIVLILRDVEGLSYEEIAACLKVELGTVRSRLHRARAEVQEKIKPLYAPAEQRMAL